MSEFKSTTSKSKRSLLEVITLSSSMMIGAGILAIPCTIMPYGIYGTLGWISACAMSMILGVSFASICKANGSGDIVSTIKSSPVFGYYSSLIARYAGFMVFLCIAISCSAICITFIKYLLPATTPNWVRFQVISVMVAIFNILHKISQKWTFNVIQIFTYIKIIAFLFVSVLGVLSLNKPNILRIPDVSILLNSKGQTQEAIETNHITKDQHYLPIGLTMYLVATSASVAFFAFIGLESNITMANEIHNPRRNIIVSMITSISIASIIFILCHLAAVNALNLNEESSQTPTKDAVERIVYEMCYHNTILPGKYLTGKNHSNHNVLSRDIPHSRHETAMKIANNIGYVIKISAIAGCIATLLSMMLLLSKLLMSVITSSSVIGFQLKYSVVASIFVLFVCYVNIFYGFDAILSLSNIPMLIAYALLSICGFCISGYGAKSLSTLSLLICLVLLVCCVNNL